MAKYSNIIFDSVWRTRSRQAFQFVLEMGGSQSGVAAVTFIRFSDRIGSVTLRRWQNRLRVASLREGASRQPTRGRKPKEQRDGAPGVLHRVFPRVQLFLREMDRFGNQRPPRVPNEGNTRHDEPCH